MATCKINRFITLQNFLGKKRGSGGCCGALNVSITCVVLSYHATNMREAACQTRVSQDRVISCDHPMSDPSAGHSGITKNIENRIYLSRFLICY